MNRRILMAVVAGFIGVLFGLLIAPIASGYDYLQDESGHILHWDSTDIPVPYVISTAYMPSLPEVLGHMVAAFNNWEAVPSSSIAFQFLGTTEAMTTPSWEWVYDPSGEWVLVQDPDSGEWVLVYDPPPGITLTADGVNTILWIGAGILTPLFNPVGASENFGVTYEVWYSTADGRITEADICLNVTSWVGWSTTGEAGKLDVQGVLTHELGHFIGLGHSTVADATVESGPTWFERHPNYEETMEMRTLEFDDIEAVSLLYPEPGVPYVPGGGEASGRGGGCLIASAAFGTPLADEVKTLCEFRDTFLMPSPLGRQLVDAYYAASPAFADKIAGSALLRTATRVALVPVVAFARMALEGNH